MSRKENKNEKLIGLTGTILFHAAVIAILFFAKIGMEQSDEGGGILVAYGANYEVVTSPASGYIPPKVTSSKDEITQDTDEPSIAAEEEKKRQEEAERTEAERKAREEQERLEAEQINSLVSGALSGKNQNSNSGQNGSPNGNSQTGASSGNAGYGTIDLGGRGLRAGESLPRPRYDNSNDEGVIVIRIVVNPSGKVIDARPISNGSSGNAYQNMSLRNSAVECAKKALFEPSDTKTNQQGTITYKFKLE